MANQTQEKDKETEEFRLEIKLVLYLILYTLLYYTDNPIRGLVFIVLLCYLAQAFIMTLRSICNSLLDWYNKRNNRTE